MKTFFTGEQEKPFFMFISVFIASWIGRTGSKDHLEDKVEHRAFAIFEACAGDTCGCEEGLTVLCADWKELIASFVLVVIC